jgi:hypothetical protein
LQIIRIKTAQNTQRLTIQEKTMTKIKFSLIAGCCLLAFLITPVSSCLAKPPKPGSKFFWLEQHTNPLGITVPGHWEYVGKPQKNRVWIPGHENNDGEWVKGHWQKRKEKERKGKKWIPGHYGPEGKWIPERWE